MDHSGITFFAVSDAGVLTYSNPFATQRVVRIDRQGNRTDVDPSWRGRIRKVSLSPDGTRLGVDSVVDGRGEVWVKTLDAGPMTRVAANRQLLEPQLLVARRPLGELYFRRGRGHRGVSCRCGWKRRDGAPDPDVATGGRGHMVARRRLADPACRFGRRP